MKNESILTQKDIPVEIIQFIEKHQWLEVDLETFLSFHTNNNGIHNHTLENLFLYFDLEKHLKKNRVVFYPHAVFIVDNRKHKFFVFDDNEFISRFDWSVIPTELYKKLIVYSSVEQIGQDLFDRSKLKEFVYDLDKVFDEETYREKYKERTPKEIKKKIYNKIIYPFKFIEKSNFRVEDINETHLEVIEEIHQKWVDYKLADPKTFKMMFSSNRYNRCIRMMIESKYLKRENFFAKIFYLDDKPIAVRQCLVIGNKSFDLGFFSLFWEVPSNFILYLNSWCLREMKEKYGVKYHNCGMQLDKYLAVSKNHFPGEDKITFKYNFKTIKDASK